MNGAILVNVAMVADDLTDDELIACYFAVTSGWDISPDTIGYGKFKTLLQNGRAHQETILAITAIFNERMGGVA
ncbi:MAG TPA: hypothetical protein VFK47_14520 [Ktedonobacteraceae bacterium]|nr:hypothetical protein [Ktedonobacteraceae bacterium]